MTAPSDITGPLAALRARGVWVTLTSPTSVRVWPGSLLDDADREWLRGNAGQVAAYLTERGVPPWDQAEAERLCADAEGLLQRAGVRGDRPDVARAAAAVASAIAVRDLECVRFAVARLEDAVRSAAPAPSHPKPRRAA